MLTIYGSDLSAPSNKVRFVANALGLEYEYKRVNLREGEQRKEPFFKLNPAGKVPAINDDGLVLFESNAISRYLARKYNSPLYPQDLKQASIVDQWVDFSSLHIGAAMNRVVFNRLFAPLRKLPVDEQSLKDGVSFLNRFLPVVDAQLQKNKYLAGDKLTIADLNLLSILDPAEMAQIDLLKYAAITNWRNGLKKQDFYTKCYAEYGESLKQMQQK